MKKYLFALLSICVPLIIIGLFLFIKNIYPFGEYTPRIFDSYYQYTGLFLSIKDFSFYSFGAGLGFNYFATATYYLLSPINFLFLFSDIFNIDLLFTIVYMIKIGLAGLFMYILLYYEKKKEKSAFLFSIIYALAGFITSYHYNIMWLDSIYLLPLVILGLNLLIKKHQIILYIITLSLCIIFNFYTGYMVCFFSLLYFIWSYFNIDKINRKGLIKEFIISSLLSGLIAMVIIVPAFFGLMQGKASGFNSDFTNYFGFNSNIFFFFQKLSPGSFFAGDQANGAPEIYSSLLCVVLFIMILFNQKYSKRYKISLFVLLLFFIISFSFNGLDYAWQLFQRPVWWNHRYSFIFSFMIIYFAYDSFINIKTIKYDKYFFPIVIISTIALFIVSFGYRYYDLSNIKSKIFLVIMAAVTILYLLSYFLLLNNNFNLFIIFLLSIELSLNTFITTANNVTGRSIESINVYDKALTSSLSNIDDSSFYRTELVNRHLYNDGLSYNYHGVNYFNSVRNQNYVNFAEYYLKFDVDSHCSTVINYFDPLLISLLDIKYIIGHNVTYYNLIKNNNSFSIYENQNNLSVGFMVNEDVKKTSLKKELPYQNITNMVNDMIDKDYIYYEEVNNDDLTYIVDNGKMVNGKVIADNYNENVVVNINFTALKHNLIVPNNIEKYKGYTNILVNDKQYISNGTYVEINKGNKVTICISYDPKRDKIEAFDFKLMNIDNIDKAITNLKTNMLKVTDSNHLLSGEITVDNTKQTLFLSIPYEDGFKIIKIGNAWDSVNPTGK